MGMLLAQVRSTALGSSVPSRTKTTPFRAKEITVHTLVLTMLRRAALGSMVRLSKESTMPAATTARMPETPACSAMR